MKKTEIPGHGKRPSQYRDSAKIFFGTVLLLFFYELMKFLLEIVLHLLKHY